MTATADPPRRPPLARLWFGWALAANAAVLLVLWIPTMLDLARSRTVRTFRRWARLWSRLALALIGVRVDTVDGGHVEARDGVPTAPVVFVSNHRAMLDIPVLLVGVPVPFLFVARSGLARLPLIGPVLRASVCVFLDRRAPGGTEAALDAAADRLALGESVLFFPEGTRRYDGTLGPFYEGAFRLAQRTGAPVVPVAVGDTHALLDERERTAWPGRVAVRVGAPIPSAAAPDAEALAALARESVARMLEKGSSQ